MDVVFPSIVILGFIFVIVGCIAAEMDSDHGGVFGAIGCILFIFGLVCCLIFCQPQCPECLANINVFINDKYCTHCGYELIPHCIDCGEVCRTAFCGACGAEQ